LLAPSLPFRRRHGTHGIDPDRTGSRGAQDFAAGPTTRRVDFSAAAWDPFLNVNTPEDLATARRLAGRR
jgi:hypothetical protein